MHRLHELKRRFPRSARLALVAPLVAFTLLGSSTAGLTTSTTWRSTFSLDLERLLGPTPTLSAPSSTSIMATAAGQHIGDLGPPVWLPRPQPFAAGAPVEHLGLWLQVPYAEEIRRVARRHEIDELLLASLVEVESGFRADAVSSRGAAGLLQLMPNIARQYGLERVFDAEPNLDAGARYLKDLERQFEGDPELALAAYFAGPAKIARQGAEAPQGQARRYVDRVLAAYSRHCQEGVRPPPTGEVEIAAATRVPLSAAAGGR